MTAVPPLVCPFDLQPLAVTDSSCRCDAGHIFPVVDGILDLCIAEKASRHQHHRPIAVASAYEDAFTASRPRRGGPIVRRLRLATSLLRTASFWRRTVKRAAPLLDAEIVQRVRKPDDEAKTIFGRGRVTHSLTKRLEKELFWEEVPLEAPACELGVHDGSTSRYLFAGRPVEFGSNYVLATMRRPGQPFPHRTLFTANIQFLPFADGALQSVFCSQTLPVVHASIVAVLAEINRVLAPGGRFAFTVHGPAFRLALPAEGWPEMGLSAAACRRMTMGRADYMSHLYTAEEWHQLLAACGLDVVLTRGLLSTDYARYVQLFYAEENGGHRVFDGHNRPARWRALLALGFLGPGRAVACEATFARMMELIAAHELAKHRREPFDDQRFFDAGIIAVKKRSLADVPRRLPQPLAS